MRLRTAVLLLPIITLGACAQPETATEDTAMKAAADPVAVRQAIDDVNARFATAFKAGDVATLTSFYDANGMAMAPNMPAMRGAAAIAEGFTGMFSEVGVTDFVLNTEDVQVGGEYAIETGTVVMTMQPKAAGAPAMTDTSKFVVVWKQQADGSWKLFRDIFNSNRAAPEGGH